MSDNFIFLAKQIEVFLNGYADNIHWGNTKLTENGGFGLARLKEEGEPYKYVPTVNLYFPIDEFFIEGKITKAKLKKLMNKAFNYIFNEVGFIKYKNIAWRALPVFIQDESFERNTTYTKLIFRCALWD